MARAGRLTDRHGGEHSEAQPLGKEIRLQQTIEQTRRLLQRAEGYLATVKSGVVTFRDGEATGEHPGRLLRGARPAPVG